MVENFRILFYFYILNSNLVFIILIEVSNIEQKLKYLSKDMLQ